MQNDVLMAGRFLFIFLVFTLTSCQSVNQLQVSITHAQPVLSDNEYIAIIQPYDTSRIPSRCLVGSVNTPTKGKSNVTIFTDIMQSYANIAQQNGANLIKLLNVQYGQKLSEPDKVSAILYRVPNVREYEKTIFWSAKRKLCWSDFKGSIPDTLRDSENYSSFASIGIQHRNHTSFLVGTNRFFVLSTFDCTQSWYRPYAYFQLNYLDFQQGLFDLTELYARKMKQKLSSKKIKDKDAFILKVDQDLSQQYKEAESKFVLDTKGGSNSNALKEWHDKIWKELAQL